MKKIYLIIHEFDVDGGFGDAVSSEAILGAFTEKEKAEEYVEKYHKPRIYSTTYDYLWNQQLSIKEIEIDSLDINISPWGKDDESDYEFFNQISDYANANWNTDFDEYDIRSFMEEIVESFSGDSTENIDKLLKLLIEDGSEQCLKWKEAIEDKLKEER